jgi:hypothetical protein
MKKTDKKLTAREVAQRFDVKKSVVLGWFLRGKFPHAKKAVDRFGVEFWEVPESDLKDFVPQKRKGKPSVENPSKETEAKRRSREKQNK